MNQYRVDLPTTCLYDCIVNLVEQCSNNLVRSIHNKLSKSSYHYLTSYMPVIYARSFVNEINRIADSDYYCNVNDTLKMAHQITSSKINNQLLENLAYSNLAEAGTSNADNSNKRGLKKNKTTFLKAMASTAGKLLKSVGKAIFGNTVKEFVTNKLANTKSKTALRAWARQEVRQDNLNKLINNIKEFGIFSSNTHASRKDIINTNFMNTSITKLPLGFNKKADLDLKQHTIWRTEIKKQLEKFKTISNIQSKLKDTYKANYNNILGLLGFIAGDPPGTHFSKPTALSITNADKSKYITGKAIDKDFNKLIGLLKQFASQTSILMYFRKKGYRVKFVQKTDNEDDSDNVENESTEQEYWIIYKKDQNNNIEEIAQANDFVKEGHYVIDHLLSVLDNSEMFIRRLCTLMFGGFNTK